MLTLLNHPDQGAVAITGKLLRLLQVKVSHTTLKRTLEEHPDYPSLLSLADGLDQWKVASAGVKITIRQLEALPLPLIAHFKTNTFVLVTGITAEAVTYFDHHDKKEILSRDEFDARWDGVALLAEAGSESGERQYVKKRRAERLQQLKIPLVLLAAGLLIILNGMSGRGVLPALFSAIMLVGMAVSGLLLWYEIDKGNPVLHKICTAGKNTNCGAVLQSGAARLWGIISWSEIGFAYFTGGFLGLLLGGFSPAVTAVVAWLNLLALPYIFFSVYYQWRVARQWCVLCLGVQGLLLAGFLINLAGGAYSHLPYSLSVGGFTVLLVSYSLPLVIWASVKPALLRAGEGRHHKTALQRLKHDPRIFEALLPKQKMITESPEGLGITLGDPHTKTRLIKVCNPYCGPCARAHPEIEAIVENNPDIQVQIIFTATDDENDRRSRPAGHLMAIYEKGDAGLTRNALNDWYNAPEKDYGVFAAKYPLNGELHRQGEKLKAMSDWCNKTGISFTPTFFISVPAPGEQEGDRLYQLPDLYSVDDLKYLLT